MIDLQATINRLKVQNVTLRFARFIDEDTAQIPKWRFLKAQYDRAEDTAARVIVSIWNAILNQERIVFCITRDWTRELIQRDENLPKPRGFDNNKWDFILLLGIEAGLFKVVEEGDRRRPTIYELTDLDTLKYLGDAVNREAQLKDAYDFVEFIDSKKSQRRADNNADEGLQTTVPAQNADDSRACFADHNADNNPDVEVRSKKEEVSKSKTDPVSENDDEKLSAMVRSSVEESIRQNKGMYPRHMVPTIEALVGRYGKGISFRDICQGVDRALAQKSRKRAYEIAKETFDAALDRWLTKDMALPDAPKRPKMISAQERSDQIEAEYSKRFRDITDELLAQVAQEESDGHR